MLGRAPHRFWLLAACLVLALAGCGSDNGGDSTKATSGTKTAAAGSRAVTSLTSLQQAASDLVRETSFKDKAGSKRALIEFNDLLSANRQAIEAKAPQLASGIEEDAKAVGEKIGKGEFGEASREAKALLNSVNDAASAVSGKPAGPATGLIAVLTQMKAAARDLDEEAKNRDAAGTKRAYLAFSQLFKSSRQQIAAKSPRDVKAITAALGRVKVALKGKDDRGQVRAASEKLVAAVDSVVAKTR